MNKKSLRKQMILKRNRQTERKILQKGNRIFDRVCQLSAFKNADTIMLYMHYMNEVPTTKIIEYCFKEKKHVVAPVVDSINKNLKLAEITSFDNMSFSNYGILEPSVTSQNERKVNDLDLILAPGVAFDLRGNRLGYGGGFYDRLLSDATRRSLNVYGLAFELQITTQLPTTTTDQKIDGLVTEDAVYEFGTVLGLPADDHLLLSIINTKLRNYYIDLDDLVADYGTSSHLINRRLSLAGYRYNAILNQFIND